MYKRQGQTYASKGLVGDSRRPEHHAKYLGGGAGRAVGDIQRNALVGELDTLDVDQGVLPFRPCVVVGGVSDGGLRDREIMRCV